MSQPHPDQFRCICDPADVFDPPDPTPRAVEGCPAHRVRRVYQRWAVNEGLVMERAAEQPKGSDRG
ncbi:hypothetical protein GCM10010199_25210 [Dactylosporangium roseum]